MSPFFTLRRVFSKIFFSNPRNKKMTEQVYAPIIDDTFTLKDAITQTLKISSSNNKLKCGIRQVTKCLLRKNAKMIFISKEIDDKYRRIVVGLAKKCSVPVVVIESGDELADMAQLGRTTLADVKKMPKCSAVAVTDFVKCSVGRTYIEQMMSKGKLGMVE
ncbi:40S ribosomal protein S12 [Trachipleistophora hominis]|uniref:40S ribosomal protein S12 n=1 Tax=Trachipleistophora hominis TaxID=72359 RepID=L7JV97_TRAHO|nr:40S ribosomal protein S12 [Trachipleistophora hominis]